MKRKVALVLAVAISALFTAGAIWGARVDPREIAPIPLNRGDEVPDYLISEAPSVFLGTFCGETTIHSPYDRVVGCTWYDWQAACRMPRMIANDYQEITAGGHGLHFTFMHQDLAIGNPAAKRYVNYTYWDADSGWSALPAPTITKMGNRAGYTGMDLIRPLEGYFKPHSRAVVCYHSTEPVFPNDDDMGTVLSIQPNAPGDTSIWGAHYWYDIPDSVDWKESAFKGMFPACAVDSLNRIHIVMNEGDTAAGWGWMGYVRCQERSGDKLMCWAPGKDSVVLDKETQYFDPLNPAVLFAIGGVESHSVVTSKVSNKVALFWPTLAESETDSTLFQWANDLYYMESTEGGDDWFTAGEMPERVNVTRYDSSDLMRAYASISALYDMNDSLHIFWHTHYYNMETEDYDWLDVGLWHWSKATERVCDGETLIANEVSRANWEAYPGAWNRLLDKLSAGIGYDSGLDNYNYLYLQWVQFDSAKTNDDANLTQGDIYISASTDGGLVWSDPFNVTNSTVPDCAPGECASDHWPSMAERVDTAVYMQWVYDLDAGGVVQDEGITTNNPLLFYHLPVDSVPVIEVVRIDWNPEYFIDPYIHLPLSSVDTVYLTLENAGTQTLNVTDISSDATWLGIDPASAIFPPGDCPVKVELVVTGGTKETFLVDSIRIQSNDEVGNQDLYVRVHLVVSDLYHEPEFALVGNPTYYLSESNVGNLGHQNDTTGFYFYNDSEEPNFLKDGSPLLGFTSPDGDSLVARYIFNERYFLAETGLMVDTFPDLKTIVVEAEFNPVTPQLPMPWHHQWWWWTIKMKDYIFYSGASGNYKEQYVALKTLHLYYNPPPDWWPLDDSLPGIPQTYLGMALDIDAPSDSGPMNNPGSYDSTRRMAYIQGYGEAPNENYRMGIAQRDRCYDDTLNNGDPIIACWPDPNTLPQKDEPYAMHILRNDAFIYPLGGYDDDSLYKYMSTSGYSIYGSGDPADYNIVTTGRVIPAQSFPPADTYAVSYALAVTGDYTDTLSPYVDMIQCGNVNRDHTVTIADVVYFINYLFKSGPEIWRYMGDCDGSGISDITDAVYLVGYLLKSGPPPQCSSL